MVLVELLVVVELVVVELVVVEGVVVVVAVVVVEPFVVAVSERRVVAVGTGRCGSGLGGAGSAGPGGPSSGGEAAGRPVSETVGVVPPSRGRTSRSALATSSPLLAAARVTVTPQLVPGSRVMPLHSSVPIENWRAGSWAMVTRSTATWVLPRLVNRTVLLAFTVSNSSRAGSAISCGADGRRSSRANSPRMTRKV